MAHRDGYSAAQRGTGDAFSRVVAYGDGRILTNDLRAGETLGLCIVPKNFVLLSYQFIISDIDGATGHSFQIGDFALANRIAATATTGQAGGTLSTLAATGLRYKFPDETKIIMTTIASATTPLAGTFTIILEGFMG